MVAVLERSSIIRVWGLFVYICDATACPRLFNATVARNACARVFVKHSNALYMQFEFSFSFPFIQVLQHQHMYSDDEISAMLCSYKIFKFVYRLYRE